jgi:hypothetical protein
MGILIIVVMAGSMFAAMFLYGNNEDNTNPDNPTIIPQETAFTYNISFDTNALRELNSMKFELATSVINKAQIDSMVQKVEGVSKVSSEFAKSSFDSNYWYYDATVALKRDSDAYSIFQTIKDMNAFYDDKGLMAGKYITVSVPETVVIHHADLNVDRNFAFSQTTMPALVDLTTVSGDNVLVSGTIKVQGKAMLEIELMESKNYSRDKR